jgi:hypothetical protein
MLLIFLRLSAAARAAVLLIWLFFFGLPMAVPTANLQANFAPPIEPTRLSIEQKINKFQQQQQAQYKKQYKAPKPPTANGRRTWGVLAIIFGGLTLAYVIAFGIIFGFIAAVFGAGFGFFWAILLISMGAGFLFSFPFLAYGIAAIENSYRYFGPDAYSNWPRLRREYSWGIVAMSLLMTAGIVMSISIFIYAFIPALALLALIRFSRLFRQARPKNAPPENPDYSR